MRTRKITNIALWATLLSIAFLSQSAQAEQVLVTIEGSYSSGGFDPNNLDGATFVATYLYDDAASPDSTGSNSCCETSSYTGISGTWVIQNRPNGAPDTSADPFTATIFLQNDETFSSAGDEAFQIFGEVLTMSAGFTLDQGGNALIRFFNSEQFFGPGPASLPGVGWESNSGSAIANLTFSGGAFYNVAISSITTELAPIPIPAAAWLFGSGLGLLGWMRRRNA